jgi:integrase
MARRKRQYGTGCLLKKGGGWAIRWREAAIAPDGTTRRHLRYEALGSVSRKEAVETLAQKIAAASDRRRPTRSHVTFRTLVGQWDTTVLPMYKHSTQIHRRALLRKHLLPRFGDLALCDVTRQAIQEYVAQLMARGYAPRSIDHIHDVLSAVLRTAVKWGHLAENPTRGVDLPQLRTVLPKWALTTQQAAALLHALPPLAKTMAGLAMLSGLRRGEIFALRWKDVDEHGQWLTVREAIYDGVFSSPKTEAGRRQIPLSAPALYLIAAWRGTRTPDPEALVFATKSGSPLAPRNVLRRAIFPACDRLQLRRATWLTFRRTYSTWSHDKGVPGKVVAQLMGHAHVDTTLNIYTQVLDGSLREAAEKVGRELITIVQSPEGAGTLSS